MEYDLARQLDALGHPQRLAVFRLLMRRYPDALPAGEITSALQIKPSTASSYFSALKNARLIAAHRDSTSVNYTIDIAGAQSLNAELFGDCCRGRADICLRSPFSARDKAMPDKFNVLFICTGNSARSIIAEAILNDMAGDRFVAFSAGSRPSGEVNPFVMELLSGKGLNVAAFQSKDMHDFAAPDAPELHFVFTVCDHAANEECPSWPGQPMTAHWGLPDPAKADGTDAEKRLAFQQTYGMLRNRLRAFTSLPFESLSAIALQREVDDIGQNKYETKG